MGWHDAEPVPAWVEMAMIVAFVVGVWVGVS